MIQYTCNKYLPRALKEVVILHFLKHIFDLGGFRNELMVLHFTERTGNDVIKNTVTS